MFIATTARRWNGWFRVPGTHPWQLLVASDDYATCLRELRAAAPREILNREILVSPRHRNPNSSRFPR